MTKKTKNTKTTKTAKKPAKKTKKVITDSAEAFREANSAAPKKKSTRKKNGKMSGLDAAAKVLAEAGEPLNAKTMVERAIEKGLWTTNGKTPAATIYAAIIREIAQKGKASRFAKAERGKFKIKQ